MFDDLVSVIIPIYKVSKYMDECVRSACNQTYQNLEIILVDDGSPDSCPAKCDKWAMVDSRIRVIHKKNGGLSDARNAGLDAANGRYVYFLDGDDYIKPELVESTVRKMVDSKANLIAFNCEIVDQDGVKIGHSNYEYGLYNLTETAARREFLIKKLLLCRIGWEAWSRLYDRRLIEKYHLRFADNRNIFAEDLYFCLCYCAHAERVMAMGERLYYYRKRPDSIMGQDGAKLNVGRMNELSKTVWRHLREWNDCKPMCSYFPAIHYLIIDNVLKNALPGLSCSSPEYRQRILADIEDLAFFKSQILRLGKCRKELALIFTGRQIEDTINHMRYLVNGNTDVFNLRKRIIRRLKHIINWNSASMRQIKKNYRRIGHQSKRVFLLGTEEFGNIGDHQINISVVAFLEKVLPNHQIYEVTAKEWETHKPFLEKVVNTDDLIVFAGGGNFGDTYPFSHKLRAEVIRRWPQNSKLVFPQTIYFSNSDIGRACLEESKLLYSKENNVVLFVREQVSFELAKQHFDCDSYLVPDIVLSAQIKNGTDRKQKILLCMRRDIEKAVNAETQSRIQCICSSYNMDLQYTDLQLDYNVPKSMRETIIEEKLELWRNAQVLVTDRLHGMVFAAITGTPCIALSNFNYKIRGTYKWIRYLPYIRFAENENDVERYLPELLEMDHCSYDNTPLKPFFDTIAQVVKNCANY